MFCLTWFYFKISAEVETFKNKSYYGKLTPVIVSGVPPPVPPLNGLTLDNLGVRDIEYVNDSVAVNPFSDKVKTQVESAAVLAAAGVFLKIFTKINFHF